MATNQNISQALRRVKQLKGRMAELSLRAAGSVSHTKDEAPAFDFTVTRAEIASVRGELVALEAAVAVANATTAIEFEGKTLTLAAAIRQLQEYKAEMAWLSQLRLQSGTFVSREAEYDEATGRHVTRKVETTFVSHLSEQARVAEIDQLRERFAALNDLVESANHRTSVTLS
ncbi:MAG: hypothetical protein NTW66_04155 [Candidatus Magasanikbacteria bacterium]|nr:hypothetical protein [Candidatus Magasanikbacteria bacterium]